MTPLYRLFILAHASYSRFHANRPLRPGIRGTVPPQSNKKEAFPPAHASGPTKRSVSRQVGFYRNGTKAERFAEERSRITQKKTIGIALEALALAAAGSAQDFDYNFDSSADFNKFKT